ncbi:hypothetical protein [Pseudosulfitobacter sp. SM2401]|uniref:hypothetical protein n=1 Tax=Pseudosulfitobacter sp. SM2401 TaxID=3350098 RepID=UPI0036F3AF62
MKTHDFAKALTQMSRLLRKMPNSHMDELETILAPPQVKKTAEIAVSLTMLASLSTYGKKEWEAIISEYALPIELRPKDAARDVLGKLLRYLEANSDERERVSREANRGNTSSELNSALKFLLKNG